MMQDFVSRDTHVNRSCRVGLPCVHIGMVARSVAFHDFGRKPGKLGITLTFLTHRHFNVTEV